MNKLLRKVPKIEIPSNAYMDELYSRNKWVAFSLGAVWSLWIVLIPLSKFPLSFNSNRLDCCVVPDFGTGKFYTKYRKTTWDIDLI